MNLSSLITRVIKGQYAPRRHAKLDGEIKEAQESMRLNTIAVESGARALDRMSEPVLRNMTGMMRLITEAEVGEDRK